MMPTKEFSKTKTKELRALIEEATIDANDTQEQLMGLATMLKEGVELPFEAKVIGEQVTVIDLEQAGDGFGVKAVCKRGNHKYKVDLTSIEWVAPLPAGFKWIEAYLEWQRTQS